ncbi:uncharacterized protein UMAG_02234 [Mycosarcoma maydis]|uniref:Uncharacterized protein n=1 Tax=Mycosarcoma maydis TaxID=5270 RepID=A0A0D1E1B4_MYCMD|nr:uncharacterized protein UMAG_02234 [Ustilago maydis 521]KIS69706.1 hypothetical protein UMAG_02234 [Ustilago maydis 521]|eukprot:XP_011388574.1 hypothetical protein UMAG_02234 [Ustilago maydis 521]
MSSAIYSLPFAKDIISSITGGKDPLYNLSWAGVPLSLLLAAIPHWYTIYLAESNKVQGGWSNVNPRFWVQSLIAKGQTKKLTPLELQILRGQSCQANSFENVPLFVASLLWANYTGLQVGTINNFVVGYLVSRAIYTLLYLKTTGKAESFARTLVFNFGIVWIITIWLKGAWKISPVLK